jgi:hypothetical protein
MRLITRWWRHGGAMTTYLLFLLLLDFSGPGTASALQFDTFSVSGFIQPRPFSTIGGSAIVTATAPDFRLGLSLGTILNFDPTNEFVGVQCFAPGSGIPRDTCRPGDRVTARAHAFFSSDIGAGAVLAGQSIPNCTSIMRPFTGEGNLCVSGNRTVLSWGSAFLPPFAGAPPGHPVPDPDILNLTTVASTFSAEFGVTIWETPPLNLGLSIRVDGVGFSGTGPAQFVLEWQPATGTWAPLFAEGRFDVAPIPEPATLLLFGTTAAGFGLARWYRRRARGQQDGA